jgi:hypothetical protein
MHFGDAEKLRDLFRRFGSPTCRESCCPGIRLNTKRGAVKLTLAETQIAEAAAAQNTHLEHRSPWI